MIMTLDLPADLVEDIQLRATQEGRGFDETVADLLRAGLAVSGGVRPRTVVHADPSMLAERRRLIEEFLSGKLGFDLSGFEEGRASDRERAKIRERAWRD